jgi:predicted Ser/Thr protein kinase
MQIRCPHCQNGIELVDESDLQSVDCPSCGSQFGLVDVDQESVDTFDSAHTGNATIGHFELVTEVGRGAFGSVWQAHDTKLDRKVAIKVPRPGQFTQSSREQFLREARAAAQLNHPNIVSVYEVGLDVDRIYIVSDFVEGISLADLLSADRLSPRLAIGLCVKVALALEHAHENGVIHRDLKPANIMLGENNEPFVMDFGLAKRDAGEITMTLDGKLLGTPAYMPPEQARGEGHHVDRRADVYSMGVVLYELLTGELPFRGTTRMLLHQVIHEEASSPRKLNSSIPRDLETITLKCLEKEPDKRYETCAALGEDLQAWLDHKPIKARPITWMENSWRWCKRKPAVALLTVVLLFGTVIVSWLWIRADVAVSDKLQRDKELEVVNSERQAAIKLADESDAARKDALRRIKKAENAIKADDHRGIHPNEQKVLDSLNSSIADPLTFINAPLADVRAFLADQYDISFDVDPAVAELGISFDTPVSISNLGPTSLLSFLNILTDELGVIGVVDEQVLKLTKFDKLPDISTVVRASEVIRSTESDRRILDELNNETVSEIMADSLSDAFRLFADHHVIPIWVDYRAVQESRITRQEPLNLNCSGLSLGSSINLILAKFGLAYIVEDGILKITTAEHSCHRGRLFGVLVPRKYFQLGNPREQRILKILSEDTVMKFTNATLREVTDQLAAKHNIPFWVDQYTLEELGISNKEISVDLTNLTLQYGLNVVLDRFNVTTRTGVNETYHTLVSIVEDEVVKIKSLATRQRAYISPNVAIGSNPNGKKIRDALETDTVIECSKLTLKEVLGDLSYRHNIAIWIDEFSLSNVGLDADYEKGNARVTLRDVSLRSGLNLYLSQFDLIYGVEDEVIVIKTDVSDERYVVAPAKDLKTDNPVERKILTELANNALMEFSDMSLRDVMRVLADRHNIPIWIDEVSLSNNGMDAEYIESILVNFQLRDMSLRCGLNVLLSSLRLAYIIEDEQLKVTTPDAIANRPIPK